ncbi:MAG TPA: twin-arginine translocation signal domain-containing protein [Actinomycetospora sp.]|nr:twin-arginine translocation signal domain-containing protein [Actinomycetospora sp.]
MDDALGHRAGAAVSRRSLLGGAAALTGAAVILGAPHDPGDAALLADDPHIHLVDRRRGYVRNTVTPREWRADFRVVGTVSNRGAPASTAASVVVPDGGGGLLA